MFIPLCKGGSPKIWPILGGIPILLGGMCQNFSEGGGEYFAKEYPSQWGESQPKIFLEGGYPRQLPPPAPMYGQWSSCYSTLWFPKMQCLEITEFYFLIIIWKNSVKSALSPINWFHEYFSRKYFFHIVWYYVLFYILHLKNYLSAFFHQFHIKWLWQFFAFRESSFLDTNDCV